MAVSMAFRVEIHELDHIGLCDVVGEGWAETMKTHIKLT